MGLSPESCFLAGLASLWNRVRVRREFKQSLSLVVFECGVACSVALAEAPSFCATAPLHILSLACGACTETAQRAARVSSKRPSLLCRLPVVPVQRQYNGQHGSPPRDPAFFAACLWCLYRDTTTGSTGLLQETQPSLPLACGACTETLQRAARVSSKRPSLLCRLPVVPVQRHYNG